MSIRTYTRRPLAFVLAIALVSGIGCSSFDFDDDQEISLLEKIGQAAKGESLISKWKKKTQPEKSLESVVKKKIRWDGAGIVLGETDSSVFSPATFVDTISELSEANRYSTIRNLVTNYPDVAITVLQEANPLEQDVKALQLIARDFDSVWCHDRGEGSTAWQSFLNDLSSGGRKKNSLLELKNQFWSHLRNDQPKKAIALKIVNRLPHQTDVVISAEFYRLEAVAFMMSDQFDKATERLRQSLELLEDVSPYQVARLKLLLGEFHRHNGELDLWKSSWSYAVNTQAELLNSKNLRDPVFWSRAAYLRPAKSDWPTFAMDQLNSYLVDREIEIPSNIGDESKVWMAVGLQHNDRNEGQNAVLAFKKSEAAAGDQKLKDQLQLFQARAMLLAAQPGAASAILIRLISEYEGTSMADRAQAILGAMKLQNGAIGQGINLIESSIGSVNSWPRSERLRAQADYGLALLVSGKEEVGLRALDQVQREFAELGEFEHFHQVLWNKAKYFEKTDQKQRFASAREELAAVEKL